MTTNYNKPLTQEEKDAINRLLFFHRDKNLDNYVGLDEARKMFPELDKVYTNLEIARLALDKVIENLTEQLMKENV